MVRLRTIKNGCGRLFFLAFGKSEQGSQVMDHLFKHTSIYPALSLLVDGVPWRQVVRQHSPLSAGSDYPTHAIEYFS
jgi:hypothetical protein